MQWVLTTGDPLANPVARRIAEGDCDLSAVLELGLREGLGALDRPDCELAVLLEDVEKAAAEAMMICCVVVSIPCRPQPM